METDFTQEFNKQIKAAASSALASSSDAKKNIKNYLAEEGDGEKNHQGIF